MDFNNKENTPHKTIEGNEIWKSRSVAVVGMMIALHEGEQYVVLGKRGPALPNEVGRWCMPCGFLDWDETCEEAVVREVWEESGLNVYKTLEQYEILLDQMDYPWKIHSVPNDEQQNVSMHYALYFDTKSNLHRDTARLPELTFDHNKHIGEVDEIEWVNVKDIHKYDICFNHDSTINVFVANLVQ